MEQYISKSALVAEIERRLDELYELLPNASKVERGTISISEACNTGKYTALESFKNYIDTIEVKEVQEEPVSDDFEKKFISFVNATHDNNGSYSLHDFTQRLYNIAKEELKEPVSEDLEKIVEEIAEPTILNAYGTKELARRLRNTICGTSVSEDLGEYINELSKQFSEVSFAKLSRIAVRVAKWQKEQMMKDAITATCFGIQGAALFTFRLPAGSYLVGSEVKVIVIKENLH